MLVTLVAVSGYSDRAKGDGPKIRIWTVLMKAHKFHVEKVFINLFMFGLL